MNEGLTIQPSLLTASTCRGSWSTLLLPIDRDESIDFNRLGEEIDVLIQANVNGIYSNGTAGEFHTQTEEEFDQVNRLLAVKCAAAGMPFQIGASHTVPLIALDRIKRSKDLLPSAFQVILPDWVKLNDEESLRYLQVLANAAAPVPLVLYNPPHAKRVLSPEEHLNLAQRIPSLISIKVLDGDQEWYTWMRPVAERIAVFVPGHHLATGVHHGVAAGAYSNVACLSPYGAQRWWQMMQDDLHEALEVEKRIQAFFDNCIVPLAKSGYSNPALDKFLAAAGGWASVGTRLRWPYSWIDESEVNEARRFAELLLPGWFFDR